MNFDSKRYVLVPVFKADWDAIPAEWRKRPFKKQDALDAANMLRERGFRVVLREWGSQRGGGVEVVRDGLIPVSALGLVQRAAERDLQFVSGLSPAARGQVSRG